MPHSLTAARRDAVLWAIDQVLKAQENNKSAAARELKVSQQALHRVLKERTVGELVADCTAAYYGTTLDGLVRLSKGSKGPVRAGDLIGWRKAVEEAQRSIPMKLEPWCWHRAADIELPLAPDIATAQFAFDLAHILARHVEVSQVSVRSVSR